MGTGRRRWVVILVLGLLPLGGTAEESQRADNTVLEVVEVTGTRILQRDYSSPSPVFTVSRETLELQGLPTLESHLNRLPQFAPDYDKGSNNPGNGQAVLNLRGLGVNRNLLLLDGKRIAPSGTNGVIDINTLPTAMVERVEVLTGGASAVYGSDAISGVINFITRQDFEGLEITGSYDESAEGDAETWSVNVAGGFNFADGRGNVNAFVDYLDRAPAHSPDRDFSRVPIVDDFATGRFMRSGSSSIPAGLLDGRFSDPPLGPITFTPEGNPRPYKQPDDLFNYQEYNYLQIGMERLSARLQASYSLQDELTGRLEVMAATADIDRQLAPPPTFNLFQTNLDSPVLTDATRQLLTDSFQLFGNGLAQMPMLKRVTETGARILEDENDSWRAGLQLQGRWLDDWQWELSYHYSRQEFQSVVKNAVSLARLEQALLVDPASGECFDSSNGCKPANIFGEGNISPEAAAFLRVPDAEDSSEVTMHLATFSTQGAVEIGLPEALGLAVGAEWRWEEGSFDPDPARFTNDVIGLGPSDSVDGDYDVAEVFVEAFLPLLRDKPLVTELSLEAGARYSDHSEAGGIETWKSGLSWSPHRDLRLRAMFQRAIRAPNLTELFTVASAEEAPAADLFVGGMFSDPCSASEDPVGQGYGELCVAQGLAPALLGVYEANPLYIRTFDRSGNTALSPEEADTWTVGFVWEPEAVTGLSLALDWYQIEIEDAVQFVGGEAAINYCFAIGQADSEFCGAFTRAADGNIDYELSTYRNLAKIEAEGVDLQIDYRFELDTIAPGQFGISLIANWNRKTSFQPDELSDTTECSGLFGDPCGLNGIGLGYGTFPEYRAHTVFSWALGAVDAQLHWQWIDEIDNAWTKYDDFFWLEGATLAADKLDSQNYLDLHAGWQVNDNFRVIAGVNNLTDNDPPRMGWQSWQNNTDPSMYDVIGRRYHLSVSWRL